MQAITLEELADIIFDEFLSKQQALHQQQFAKSKTTVKDRFIEYFKSQKRVPLFNEGYSRIIMLGILQNQIVHQKTFLNYRVNEDGTDFYDFEIFENLFKDK